MEWRASFVISINSERFCIRCSARIIAYKVGGLVGGEEGGLPEGSAFWACFGSFAAHLRAPTTNRSYT